MNAKRLYVVLMVFAVICSACGLGEEEGRAGATDSLVTYSLVPGSAQAATSTREFVTEIPLYGVSAGRVLADGRVLILNGGMHEVIMLDADGAVEWRFGREGDGPGEFRRLSGVVSLTDDVAEVLDSRLGRVTRIRNGQLVDVSTPWRVGVSTGVRMLGSIGATPVAVDRSVGLPASALTPHNEYQDSIDFLALRTETDSIRPFMSLPGPRVLVNAAGTGTTIRYPELLPAFAVGDDGVFFLEENSMVLQRSDLDGNIADLAQFTPRTKVRGDFLRRNLLVGYKGSVWLSGLTNEGDSSTTTWFVLPTSREALSSLELPARWRPLDSRACMLLGVRYSEMGEESVELLRLEASNLGC